MEPDFRPHPLEWTPERVGRFWDFYAHHPATRFFSEVYGPSLVALIRKVKPQTYVDIGSGTGALVIRAAEHGIRSYGVEPREEPRFGAPVRDRQHERRERGVASERAQHLFGGILGVRAERREAGHRDARRLHERGVYSRCSTQQATRKATERISSSLSAPSKAGITPLRPPRTVSPISCQPVPHRKASVW